MSCCRWKMLHIIFLYFVLATQYLYYKATPLSGRDVNVAYQGENPFIVSLSHSRNCEREKLNHFCGGSLISTKHILTAGHCLLKKKYHEVVAKVGSIDLRKAKIYAVAWWITYNKWADIEVPDELSASVYDIAVVKLRQYVIIDVNIIPEIAFIPKESLYGKTVETGGWGDMEGNITSKDMRIAQFSVKSPEKCNGFVSLTDPYLKERIPKLYLCAIAPGARAECGDSGNPILFDKKIVAVVKGSCITKITSCRRNYTNIENLLTSLDYDPRFVTELMKK